MIEVYDTRQFERLRRFTTVLGQDHAGRQREGNLLLVRPSYFSSSQLVYLNGIHRLEVDDQRLLDRLVNPNEWLSNEQRDLLNDKSIGLIPARFLRSLSHSTAKFLMSASDAARTRFAWWVADGEHRTSSPLIFSGPAVGRLSEDGSRVVLWQLDGPPRGPADRHAVARTGAVNVFDAMTGRLEVERSFSVFSGPPDQVRNLCQSADGSFVTLRNRDTTYVVDLVDNRIARVDITPPLGRGACFFSTYNHRD